MSWFKYVWVGFLVLAYIIWTIKCVIDFISDVRSVWRLSYLLKECDTTWGAWIIIHLAVVFLGSLSYFFWSVGL